jgi:hypothetical protein
LICDFVPRSYHFVKIKGLPIQFCLPWARHPKYSFGDQGPILVEQFYITLYQALHWRSGHKNDCLQMINSSEASSSVLPAVGKGDCI